MTAAGAMPIDEDHQQERQKRRRLQPAAGRRCDARRRRCAEEDRAREAQHVGRAEHHAGHGQERDDQQQRAGVRLPRGEPLRECTEQDEELGGEPARERERDRSSERTA